MIHNLPFVYVHKVLLDHSNAHSCMCYIWLLLHSTSTGEELHRDCMARKLKIIYCLDFYQKSLLPLVEAFFSSHINCFKGP